MKLFSIILLFASLNCFGQFAIPNPQIPSKGADKMTPDIYVPLLTWGGTFAINQYRMNNLIGTEKQTRITAITGLSLGIVSHIIIKEIKRNKKYTKYKKKRKFKKWL
jgi:hypothetical protein